MDGRHERSRRVGFILYLSASVPQLLTFLMWHWVEGDVWFFLVKFFKLRSNLWDFCSLTPVSRKCTHVYVCYRYITNSFFLWLWDLIFCAFCHFYDQSWLGSENGLLQTKANRNDRWQWVRRSLNSLAALPEHPPCWRRLNYCHQYTLQLCEEEKRTLSLGWVQTAGRIFRCTSARAVPPSEPCLRQASLTWAGVPFAQTLACTHQQQCMWGDAENHPPPQSFSFCWCQVFFKSLFSTQIKCSRYNYQPSSPTQSWHPFTSRLPTCLI